MIRTIIIDDEPNNVNSLRKLVNEYCPQLEIVATADNAETGYNAIRVNSPDLVFLDIEMPYGNAFDLLDRLKPVSFSVIFVTGFNNYAIKAIKYSALDYILKPVNIQELKSATEKVIQLHEKQMMQKKIDMLLENFQKKDNEVRKIALQTHDSTIFRYIDDIVRLEASGNYVHVYFNNKEKIIVTKILKDFESILPPEKFCRIHHSHIINLNYVKKYFKGSGGQVEMEDHSVIDVSARKKEEFLLRFKK